MKRLCAPHRPDPGRAAHRPVPHGRVRLRRRLVRRPRRQLLGRQWCQQHQPGLQLQPQHLRLPVPALAAEGPRADVRRLRRRGDGRRHQLAVQLAEHEHEARDDDDRRQRHRVHEPDHRLHHAGLRVADRLVAEPDQHELPAKLNSTYAAIRAKAPNARVVILGYGRPFASPSRTCLGATGVSSDEETRLTTLVDSLNNTIKTRALAYGFSYADVNPYWAGHDVCASNPFTNGLTLLHTADSYHPTRNGYANGDVPAIRSIIG